jgi:hypothetical protein
MATYDSILDVESYACAPYIRRQYFTEAYRIAQSIRLDNDLRNFVRGRMIRRALLVAGCVPPPPPP